MRGESFSGELKAYGKLVLINARPVPRELTLQSDNEVMKRGRKEDASKEGNRKGVKKKKSKSEEDGERTNRGDGV